MFTNNKIQREEDLIEKIEKTDTDTLFFIGTVVGTIVGLIVILFMLMLNEYGMI